MGQVLFYALTMFISYIIAGVVVLIPYLLNLKHHYAYSIGIAIVLLFVLIYAIQKNVYKAAIMTIAGAIILAITVLVGRFLEGRNANAFSKQ